MFNIVSQNVKGLQDKIKRRELFYHMKTKGNIVCLQETHSEAATESIWQNEWRGKALFSHGTSAARGVCVLFAESSQCEIIKVSTDDAGRYIIVNFQQNAEKYVLVNLYAPNEDKPHFFLEIFEKLLNFEGHRILIGDFNLALECQID